MVVRRITAGERRRAEEIFSIAFETPWQEETYPTEKYAAFLEDDETMTSCLSILPFSVCFDGETVKMAGIGGVSSLPQYRRTGGIRGCFEKMLPDLYQEGYVLSMLYPFSTNYYRKFGYEVWARGARYEMDLSYIPKLSREGGFMLADSSNRDRALEDIRLLTKEWEGRYNGMVKLTEREYAFVTEADPYRKQEFVYIHYDGLGAPTAYMVCRRERDGQEQRLVCSRFVFRGREGIEGLLTLAKSMQADHRSIVFTLPTSLRIDSLIDEWSMGAYRRGDVSLGMARIVHVESALKAARYRGSGRVSLEIADGQIAENNGVFTVCFEGGRAVSVVRDSGEKAVIRMEISEFSRFLTGAVDVSALLYSRRAYGFSQEDLGVLGQVFYEKPCFLTEYF
ncbi:MAG: GNAT family N-acetyltransferase [Acetatifactor sp.]